MSYNSPLTPCPDLQGSLDEFYNTCNASRLREPAPFFDFLNSSLNNFGYSQVVAPGNGKVKTIQLIYRQRLLESVVKTRSSCDNICSSNEERGDLMTSCTIDPCEGIYADESFNARHWTAICRDNGIIFAEILQSLIDVVMRKLATDLTDDAASMIGKWNANVQNVTDDCLQVALLNSDGTMMSPDMFVDIQVAMTQTGYCAAAPIFSGTKLLKYFMKMQAGCCSNEGIALDEILRLYGKAVLYDKRVVHAAGDDDAIGWVLQPGSLALVHYNQYEGTGNADAIIGTSDAKNYWSGVILDPKTGFPLDLLISDNCGKVSVIVEANAKLCPIPNDMFNAADENDGVTFFNCINAIDCATNPCS